MPSAQIATEDAIYALANALEEIDRLKPYAMNPEFRYFVEGAAARLDLAKGDYDEVAVLDRRRRDLLVKKHSL